MRAIMVMFDSLRRDVLPSWGGTIDLPNFRRLAAHAVAYDNNYVCSLPCIPARRDLHIGRPSFLHRNWGPLEPFDISAVQRMTESGIHTHLSTDHLHYFEDGGATYHGRFTTWDFFRGQEIDAWKLDCSPKPDGFAPTMLTPEQNAEPLRTDRKHTSWYNQANRAAYQKEKEYPQTRTFDSGIDFIRRNAQYDNWFLQIETFDPHEPFDAPDNFTARWFDPDSDDGIDWPPYGNIREAEMDIAAMRRRYYALVQFCDKSLGRVLDAMDQYDMWKNTLLLINTDHGFLLGEHDWWGKNIAPDYQEIANIPLFLWDPRRGEKGIHKKELVQTIDIAPTLLDFFGLNIPKSMTGRPIDSDMVRNYAIFGMFGSVLNITDGRYVYMRAVRTPQEPIGEYTLMPTRLKGFFGRQQLQTAALFPGSTFTNGIPTLRCSVLPPRADKL